ncbi:MAG: anthranilate synthase component II [Planctomycetota bacterium]|jgi:anthranilate synthase/aminodeoxychorismate synthase-like glutamine amidotransferase
MHLLIDNYDSFTYNVAQAIGYNVAQAIGALGREVKVVRNDEIDLENAAALSPASLIISPGPGRPESAGVSKALIRHFHDKIPILGICLGHQCIVEEFGGVIDRARNVMHGKVSSVYHDNRTVYDGLSNPFTATRYHSLIAGEDTLPPGLEVTAYTSEGEIMGVRMKGQPVEGVQFHPESILTPEGVKLIENFLAMAEGQR